MDVVFGHPEHPRYASEDTGVWIPGVSIDGAGYGAERQAKFQSYVFGENSAVGEFGPYVVGSQHCYALQCN